MKIVQLTAEVIYTIGYIYIIISKQQLETNMLNYKLSISYFVHISQLSTYIHLSFVMFVLNVLVYASFCKKSSY